MRYTYSILFIFLLYFGSLIFPNITHAEPSVKDCLESDSDCLEEVEENEQPPSKETKNDLLEPNESKTSSIILNIFKIIFALILVVLLIYIFLTLLKKKNKLSEQNGALENLGGLSVGQQKSIQIIRIGDKVYAIGVGQDVTMLDEIEDEALISQLKENVTSNLEPMSYIQRLLPKKQQTKQKNNKDSQQFTDTLKLELDKLKQQRDALMDTDKKDDDKHG